MRKETMHNKLMELLGLEDRKIEVDQRGRAVSKKNDAPLGVSDEELDSYREAQAVVYFLRAPELFSHKVCPHCGENFLISRQFVAFCSYTCIYKDLESKGIIWSAKSKHRFEIDEEFVKEKLEGNEPLWIRQDMIERIQAVVNSTPKESLLSGV